MEIIYYKDPKGNFGDDLNAELWPDIFSKNAFSADDVVLVGIGSILSQERLAHLCGSAKRVLVLGSGTSYDLPPKDMAGWSILAVRGPLTAAMIGKPEAAITDGAILLALASDLTGPPQPRTDVIFMPHHRSVRASPWKRIAQEAGLSFVSPQLPVRDILSRFARAKLVITEAMHGAIVADTLRIPWIPIVIAPTLDEFKWRDWCLSMNLPFKPVRVVAGHVADCLRYRRAAAVLEKVGLSGHTVIEQDTSVDALQRYFRRRFSDETKRAVLGTRTSGLRDRARLAISSPMNPVHRAKSVASLCAAAASGPYLSSDEIFSSRLARMQQAVALAEKIIAEQA